MRDVLSENAYKIAKDRYFINGEGWEGCCNRVSSFISSIESSNKEKIRQSFFEMIYNMDFIPAGRILRNCGRAKGSLFNCYHLGLGDSIEEIGQCLKDCLILWSSGGGVGVNFSPLRPKNDPILGKGGTSSGLVSFLESFDRVADTIESGGSRRAAAIAHVDISHPEIIDFIDAKLTHGKLSHFNISVMINNEFLEAVEKDDPWTFKFKQKNYGTVKARDIWNKIVNNMLNCAEPGLINSSNFMKNNSYYFAAVTGCNPCIVGDTLIAVADGRNYVSIKQLAEEGNDVPVHCCNSKGIPKVRMGRNSRKTGSNVKVFKVMLDDGTIIRTTENHKFVLRDGTKVELKDLKVGSSLMPFNKRHSNNGKMYWYINYGVREVSEHKLVAEYFYGNKGKGYLIHHKDGNSLNNEHTNLQWLTIGEHNLLEPTIYDQKGEKNGMFGKKQKESSKELIRNKLYEYYNDNTIREKHSAKIKLSMTDEVRQKISKGKIKERIKIKTFCKSCHNEFEQIVIKDNPTPTYFCCKRCHSYYAKSFFTGFTEEQIEIIGTKSKEFANTEEGKKCKSRAAITSIKSNAMKCANVLLNNNINIDRYTWDSNKKVANDLGINYFVSENIISKYWNSNWDKFIEDSQSYNHKIVAIIEDGYEDVYNLTVDEFHNYAVITNPNNKTLKKKNLKLSGIYVGNCGEAILSPGEACDLGSLVLPNFITGSVNTNWKKLDQTIRTAVRFLDNVIEVNKYDLKEIDIKVHDIRRIGIGVIGLAEYLFAKGLRYGSEKAVIEVERLMRSIRDSAYQASIELSIEKGAFPKFEPIQYGKASFVRKLPAQLRMDIKKHGIRNCTLLSLAPTGTISLLAEKTSGIEPLFAKAYRRNDRVGERVYIHNYYKELISSGKEIPEWFVDAFDLEPEDHFEIQVACQKYCDAAVSKTINLPESTTEDQLSDLLLEYVKDLKGVTCYRDKSRQGQILNRMNEEEVKKYLESQNKISSTLEVSDVKCSSGTCEI